jgi:hypothetical protein
MVLWQLDHSMQLVHFMYIRFSEWDHAHCFMFTCEQSLKLKNIHMNIKPLLLKLLLHKDHAVAT